tara:strand:- start:246 stop:428 length:183 start_codon:yes stop_codon:yes gene_type:complete
MREATIEVLAKGEKVLGSPTIGRYMVREYTDERETGGAFYKTLKDADKHVAEYIQENDDA